MTDDSPQDFQADDYVCGKDFCDCCGDCLACYGDDCSQHRCPRCSEPIPPERWL